MKTTVFLYPEHLEMIREAILNKMLQNRKASEMITNENAKNELQKEISKYNDILQILCDDANEIIIKVNNK